MGRYKSFTCTCSITANRIHAFYQYITWLSNSNHGLSGRYYGAGGFISTPNGEFVTPEFARVIKEKDGVRMYGKVTIPGSREAGVRKILLDRKELTRLNSTLLGTWHKPCFWSIEAINKAQIVYCNLSILHCMYYFMYYCTVVSDNANTKLGTTVPNWDKCLKLRHKTLDNPVPSFDLKT